MKPITMHRVNVIDFAPCEHALNWGLIGKLKCKRAKFKVNFSCLLREKAAYITAFSLLFIFNFKHYRKAFARCYH